MNIKMVDQIMNPLRTTIKTKMVLKMRMNKDSLIIPPPLLTMDKKEQRHCKGLIRT
jgi:hypothetical protein